MNLVNLVKFFLCIIMINTIRYHYGMESFDDNLFKTGFYTTLEMNDEHKFLLIDKPIARSYTGQPTQETIHLITQFLSLPNELRTYIFDFLDGHCLAYYVHLKCLNKKNRKLAYKKLEKPHIISMLRRYAANQNPETLSTLYNEALCFAPRKRHPFTDLKDMHDHLRWHLASKSTFKKLLENYTKPNSSYDTYPEYYHLKKDFLDLISKKIMKQIRFLDNGLDCVLLSRYIPGTELCCLGALYLLPSAPTSIGLGLLSFFGCIAWTGSCYAINMCCNCPEEALLWSCIDKTPCSKVCNLLCYRNSRVRSQPPCPCPLSCKFSKFSGLQKVKQFIATAQQMLQSHADFIENSHLQQGSDLETEEKI